MSRPLEVVFLHRKPRSLGTFSIEFIFEDIRRRLPASIRSVVKVSKYPSNGIWMRLYNLLEAAFAGGDVKHITGDVHYLALLLRKRRAVLTIHDCYVLYLSSGPARLFFQLFWFYLPVRRVARVVAVSEATKQEIVKFTGCDPDKISVIYSLISSAFKPVHKDFDEKKPALLHIGMAPNKNFDRMVEALEGIPCHLTIVGKLEDRHREKLARHRVAYTAVHNISDDEMRKLYEACDVVVFVSVYEGFGMPILEANVVGRPVLTSNLSSMPEVAGQAACLVDPYDVGDIRRGLLRIIGDPSYRAELVGHGFANVGRFDPDTIADQYAQLYFRVARGER